MGRDVVRRAGRRWGSGSITAVVTSPLAAIERAVASVADPTDPAQRRAALGSVSPALIDDIVFGTASAALGAAADGRLLAIGAAASPGVGVGRVITDASRALEVWEAGVDIVLVLDHTTPADEPAMRVATAIVTRSGGVSSHAGIIARQWNVPAVCGVGDVEAISGQFWMVDGSTGEVRSLDDLGSGDLGSGESGGSAFRGSAAIDELPDAVATLLGWADEVAGERLRVFANADDSATVDRAVRLGAGGVGLCRTEHQFLGDAVALVRAVLVDPTPDAIEAFATHQRDRTSEVLGAAGARPVSIRLLDAPSHEFGGPAEVNPMLGARGVRAAVLHPDLLAAQVRAIAEGFASARSEFGDVAAPTVLVPMVSIPAEVDLVAAVLANLDVGLALGAMVETPRAALCSAMLAPKVAALSFGTNDLTQLTYGLSRDDSTALIAQYRRRGLLERDPFASVDPVGVARLIALSVETARGANEKVAFSLCGDQAADPATIALAHHLGITTLSVSPSQVPAARLAAAHAVLGVN